MCYLSEVKVIILLSCLFPFLVLGKDPHPTTLVNLLVNYS